MQAQGKWLKSREKYLSILHETIKIRLIWLRWLESYQLVICRVN